MNRILGTDWRAIYSTFARVFKATRSTPAPASLAGEQDRDIERHLLWICDAEPRRSDVMGIRPHQDDVSDEPIIQDRAPPDRRDRARSDELSHHLDITLSFVLAAAAVRTAR